MKGKKIAEAEVITDVMAVEPHTADAPAGVDATETVSVLSAEAQSEAAAVPAEQKRRGRKPMTEEEKEAAAKKRAEEKAKAESMVPTLILQYDGGEFDTAELTKAAMADFKANNKRTLLTELRVYLKPQDRAVYYVANDKITGKVKF